MKIILKLLFFIIFSFLGFKNLNSMDEENHVIAVIRHNEITHVVDSATNCIRTMNSCLDKGICCAKWTTCLCAVVTLALTGTALGLKYLHFN